MNETEGPALAPVGVVTVNPDSSVTSVLLKRDYKIGSVIPIIAHHKLEKYILSHSNSGLTNDTWCNMELAKKES